MSRHSGPQCFISGGFHWLSTSVISEERPKTSAELKWPGLFWNWIVEAFFVCFWPEIKGGRGAGRNLIPSDAKYLS